jgi:DivIVA domain-containing protein
MTTSIFGGGPDPAGKANPEDGPDPRSLPVPGQIRQAGFSTVRKGGYSPEEVHGYLDKLADWIDWFRTQLAATRSRLERTEEELRAVARDQEDNAYVQLGHHAAEVLRVADQHADKIRFEAQQIADQEIERARERGRKLLGDVEAEAARVRQESHELLQQAQGRANAMLAESETLQREARSGAEREISAARARAAEILHRSEAEADRIREHDRIDRSSIHEEAGALLAAGDELRATLESMHQRLARFADGLVDSPTRSEEILYAPSGVPATEPTHAAPAHQRRDDVSADADRRSDEFRQLFSDTETVDVRLEGLGEELFSDGER